MSEILMEQVIHANKAEQGSRDLQVGCELLVGLKMVVKTIGEQSTRSQPASGAEGLKLHRIIHHQRGPLS